MLTRDFLSGLFGSGQGFKAAFDPTILELPESRAVRKLVLQTLEAMYLRFIDHPHPAGFFQVTDDREVRGRFPVSFTELFLFCLAISQFLLLEIDIEKSLQFAEGHLRFSGVSQTILDDIKAQIGVPA